MDQISVRTGKRTHFIDITSEIRQASHARGFQDGVITVFVPHTTAGITINENADPDVVSDLDLLLDRIVPWSDAAYRHMEGNTAAHLKASIMGSSVQVICSGGELQLGTWQGIYFTEFDGPRNRRVWINFLENK